MHQHKMYQTSITNQNILGMEVQGTAWLYGLCCIYVSQ